MKNISGIFPALLTPFTKDDQIDDKQLEELIEMNLAKGVNGFYVCGSTGEAFLLSPQERMHILETVTSVVNKRAAVIAHIGNISTKSSILLAQHAEKVGADVISSVPPFYYGFSFEEIKNYYFDIVNNTNLPMIIYNFPKISSVALNENNIAEFLNDKRFIGVKHTSNDLFMLERLKHQFPDKTIYNGYDEMFISGLAAGADGGIGSTYNFMAEKFIAIKALFHNGKISEAQKIQGTINTIIKALISVGVMQGEKEILSLMDIDFGNCRAPFKPLNETQKNYIKNTILPLL